MQRLHRVPVVFTCRLDLVLNDRGGARLPGEAYDNRGFEFAEIGPRDAQGVHDDPIAGQEFHEIEAAERGRVLVLPPAGELGVDAFDLEGEPGYIIAAERQAEG